MNTKGICYQAYIPVRKEPAETSEMVNQVLFGELFSISEVNKEGNFTRIALEHDGYEGWIHTNSIFALDDIEYQHLSSLPLQYCPLPFHVLGSEDRSQEIITGFGSIYRLISPGITRIQNTEYHVPQNHDLSLPPNKALIKYGLQLRSIPYLWGGRSAFGFDCSGLCQSLFRLIHINLPRDASQQSTLGKNVDFIQHARTADLAFFDNTEGRIIHVGVLLGEGLILHASGKVRVDKIDQQGIFSSDTGRYTHKLRLIRRVL